MRIKTIFRRKERGVGPWSGAGSTATVHNAAAFVASIFYSIIETAKLAGLDSADVLWLTAHTAIKNPNAVVFPSLSASRAFADERASTVLTSCKSFEEWGRGDPRRYVTTPWTPSTSPEIEVVLGSSRKIVRAKEDSRDRDSHSP